jgi:hypothetical protein
MGHVRLSPLLVDVNTTSINALDKQTFEKLKTRKSMLEKTTTNIFPYGSSKPIPLIGFQFMF